MVASRVASWKRTVAAVALGVALGMAGSPAGQASEELTPGLQAAQIAAAGSGSCPGDGSWSALSHGPVGTAGKYEV